MSTNVLFICRANCFRSKVAEAYFKKINNNKNIKIKSAGVIVGYKQGSNQIGIAKKLGLNIKNKPQGITANLLKWTDILVIVADDVPKKIFEYEKKKKIIKEIIVFGIKDVKSIYDDKDVKRAIRELINEIDKLNEGLKNAI